MIVEGLTITIPTQAITAIIGPNGCGKSTLLKALARILIPEQGKVEVNEVDIHSQSTKEIARQIGLLPQNPRSPDGITVSDLIQRGRYPHQGIFRQWSREDEASVNNALSLTGLTNFSDKPIDELSGGQRQRVWIAMLLAQETPIMLLDEPTTHLDIAHQIEVLDLLKELTRQHNRTIVMVLHDINLAVRYADNLIAMRDGKIKTFGEPHNVVTAQMMHEVFSIQAQILQDPVSGSPLCIPVIKNT
jgi:iron complex transport system ATP-binding protein|tara:strand:+ start:2155 stop:2892 length:738 start_codon:yes stop_codon:yes gene_type:complete